MEVSRDATPVVSEIFDDIADGPFAIAKFLVAIAARTSPTLSVIDTWFAAIEVQLGQCYIRWPLQRIVFVLSHVDNTTINIKIRWIGTISSKDRMLR